MAEPVYVATLFSPEPARWGFRGDPHLWKEMRARLADVVCPNTVTELTQLLESVFEELTGFPIGYERGFTIERFAFGGMTSGMISTEFWREDAVPLLCSRLEGSASVP